jgi:hypothetical protein
MLQIIYSTLTMFFFIHLYNPFALLTIGLLIYSFNKKTVSLAQKTVLLSLFLTYLVSNTILTYLIGAMSLGGATTKKAYLYCTAIEYSIIALYGVLGIFLLKVLSKPSE